MKVIRAEVLGMCFGVRDALKHIEKVSEPSQVSIYGQLVHNEVVSDELERRGFRTIPETTNRPIPLPPIVLITAHGLSDRERTRLESAGKTLIDTTCPLVKRAHLAAKRLQDDGFYVLVVGRANHVEVLGIVGDLDRYEVVESVADVRAYPSHRLGIVCQTTAASIQVDSIRDAIRFENPDAEIQFVDTVCLPTKEHQRSLERLLDQVDAVVVVGGRNSNNTKELTKRCRERGKKAFQVVSASELQVAWFDGYETVGLTAGTSTLDRTIAEVEAALLQIEPLPMLELPVTSLSESLPLQESAQPWGPSVVDRG